MNNARRLRFHRFVSVYIYIYIIRGKCFVGNGEDEKKTDSGSKNEIDLKSCAPGVCMVAVVRGNIERMCCEKQFAQVSFTTSKAFAIGVYAL